MATLFNLIKGTIKHWYIPLIIGLLFLVLGIYIFTTPVETYLTLSILFSLSFLISGLSDMIFSIQNRKGLPGWGWYLISGIISVLLGLYLIRYPGVSMVVLPFVVGFTMLFRSAYLLGFAFDLKSYGAANWGNLAIASILGMLLSFLLLANPIFTGMSLSILTAFTFIFIGISSMMLSFSLKKIKDHPQKISAQIRSRIEQLQNEIEQEIKK